MMTRLVRMHLQEFKSYSSVDIELGDLTVLVGPNASGKSNAVDGIRFMSDAFQRGLGVALDMRGGYGSVVRRTAGRGRPKDIALSYYFRSDKFPEDLFEYSVTLGALAEAGYRLKEERLVQQSGDRQTIHLTNRDGHLKVKSPDIEIEMPQDRLALPFLENHSPFNIVYEFFHDASFYTVYPDHLRGPQRPTQGYRLVRDAANLASVIKKLSTENAELTQQLVSDLAHVAPGITGVEVKKWGGFYVVRLKHGGGEDTIWSDLSMESDGTIRALALFTAIYTTPAGTLLALEEPELTIHPGATKVIADTLKAASSRYQVIVTTHSPDLLNEFEPEQILVVEKRGNTSHIGPVDKRLLDLVRERLYDVGELHRMGELALPTGE